MLTTRIEKNFGHWALGLHLAGLCVAICECGLLLHALVLPVTHENDRMVTRGEYLQSVLAKEQQVVEENEKLRDVLAEADQKIQSLLDRIPGVPRESDFLGQITTLARDVNLEILDYHPGSVQVRDDYSEMSLTLTSQGTYEGVCTFLHRLHSLPRLSRATKISIVPSGDRQAFSLDMQLTIYFSPTSGLASAKQDSNRG